MGGLSGPLYTCAVGQVLSRWRMPAARYLRISGAIPRPRASPRRPGGRYGISPGDAQVTVVETDDAAQTLSLQVDYGDTSLQFTSDLEDAVAAVASEAEGELPWALWWPEATAPSFSSSTQYRPRLNPERLRPSGGGALFNYSRCPHPRGCRPHQPRQKTEWAPRPGVFRPRYCFFVCHSGSPGRRRSSILTYIRITCIIQL